MMSTTMEETKLVKPNDAGYEYFNDELYSIRNEEIRNNTFKVLEKVNANFYAAPASSTGKYHPEYALGYGGLYRHTRAAVKIANCLLHLTGSNNFSDTLKDYIRAALILHDTCKCGINWEYKYTTHDHPLLACDLIKSTLGDCEYTDAVCNLVKTHMGEWTKCKYSKVILPEPQTSAQHFVHACDYLASRKFIEIKFDE